jgi:hypothetical protein
MTVVFAPRAAVRGAWLTAWLAALPLAGHAQSYETGGIQLTFDNAISFFATDNEGPRTNNEEASLTALFTPAFGLLTQTPTSSFGFEAASNLRYGSSSNSFGVIAPRMDGRYMTNSANAGLKLIGRFRQMDLDEEKFAIHDGADSTDFVNGTATRQNTALEANVDWGRASLAAFGLSARQNQTTYSSGDASGLNGSSLSDNKRLTLGANTQLDLNQALQLHGALGYSQFEDDTSVDDSETYTLSTGVSLDRPLGALSTEITVTDSPGGQRYGWTAGRTLDLPLGPVTAQLGAMALPQDETVLIGSLSTLRTFAASALNFELSRDVSSLNEQNSERLTTQVLVGYTRALTRDTDFQVSLDAVHARDIATDSESFDATFDAIYSRALTPDWTGDMGYSYRYLEDTPGDSAQANTIYVSLRRKFVTSY